MLLMTKANQKEEIKLIELHNRYADFRMKGTWGYVKPELKEQGFVMMTAESTVEEFKVNRVDVVNENEIYIEGVDRYGRELRLPHERILSVYLLDTAEQAKLIGLEYLVETYAELVQHIAEDSSWHEDFKNYTNMRNELIEKGVKPYQRKDVANV